MGTHPIRPWTRRWQLPESTIELLLAAIAVAFVLGGSISLAFTPLPATLTTSHLVVAVGGWVLSWGMSAWVLHTRLPQFDRLLLPLTALLTGWGLLMQARLAPARLYRQVLWLVLGCAGMCVVALAPGLPRLLRRYRYTLLTSGLVLLGATLVFGVNPSGYGQRLWLGAGGLYLQPSEPLKLLLVIYLAAYLSDKREALSPSKLERPTWFVVVGPMAAMVGLSLLLLGWQQDLGAALLFYCTSVTMIYLAWGNPWYVLLGLALFVPVGLAGTYLSDRVALRVSIWLDPWAPAQADRAFQILQSLFAFGSGGLIGQGLGQGSPGLIPAVHTDFVFAALAEEFGLVGTLGLLLLIAAFCHRGIRQAQQSESTFESLLAGGIAALIAIQTWVIAGGNAKLIPITGVTLPFLSHGGSSLVTTLLATGLLINLSAPHPVSLSLSIAPESARSLRHTTARLGQGLLVLLGSVAIISGNWAVVRANELRQHPTNARPILAESRIRRGRILDRNATVLADIAIDDMGYVTRTYPVPEAAAVVGYATLEYGTDGIEAACDARLRGDVDRTAWDDAKQALLHIDPTGRDVRLTIDADLQRRAQGLLEGAIGATVLIDARTGEILALASSPIYRSESIVDEWATLRESPGSPFVNRATQGLSQPGSALQPFILASAWVQDPNMDPASPLTTPVVVDGLSVVCRTTPGEEGWAAALASACPYPFKEAAEALGALALEESLTRWGFLDAPSLALPAVASDPGTARLDPAAEAVGQGRLLVTPLQMVQAIATLGNDGLRPTVQLLSQPLTGCTTEAASEATQVMDAAEADRLLALLSHYGGPVGHLGTAVAGPGRQQAWFVGLNSATLPRYAVAVFIDRPERVQFAVSVGVELLEAVTNPR